MATKIPILPAVLDTTSNIVAKCDASRLLSSLSVSSVQLVYVDPPFNTGKTQSRTSRTSQRSEHGTTPGFKGKSYKHVPISPTRSYADSYDDYLGFIAPLLTRARDLLTESGTLYVHLDYREVHYVKVALDTVFGRENFLNEIIWAYDYGAKSNRRWPTKHDNILVYAKNAGKHYFDNATVDREPYMAPGLVTPEKAARGKLPTDVWWHTIVSPTGKEKTGYPTQKPEGVLRRVVSASSAPGDTVLDFFGGSGTTAAVAAQMGRRFITCDNNTDAIKVMRKRLAPYEFSQFR